MPSSLQSPQSGRRAKRAILWIVIGLLLVLFVGIPGLWLFGGEWMAGKTAEFISNGLLKDSGSRISISNIHGIPWRTVILEDIAFLVEDSLQVEVPFITTPRMEVQFNPLHLLRGNFTIQEVKTDRLSVRLVPQEGTFVLPVFPESENPEPSSFRMSIDHLLIHDGLLSLGIPEMPLEFTGMEGDIKVDVDASGIRMDPYSFEADVNDSLGRLRLTHGYLVVAGPEGTLLDSLGGVWDESDLTLHFQEGKSGDGTLRVVVSNLEGWIIQALTGFENVELSYIDSADVTFGLTENLTMAGQVSGRWEHYQISQGEFVGITREDAFDIDITRAHIWGGVVTQAHVHVPIIGPEIDIDCSFSDIDLEDVLADQNVEVMPGLLSGHVTIHIADRELPEEGHRIQVRLGSGHVLEVPFESVEGFVVGGIESGYHIQDALVTLAEGSFEATGKVGAELVDMDIEFWGNLRPLRRLVMVDDLDGEGDLSATVFGPPDSLVISAKGFVENVFSKGTTIPRIDFNKIRGPIIEGRHLELGFEITQSFSLAAVSIDTVLGDILVQEDGVKLTRLHVAKGDSTLDVTGSLLWEPVFRAALETGFARIGIRGFELVKPVVVTYEKGVVSADSLALATSQGNFVASGAYDIENQWVEVNFGLQDLDPLAVIPRSYLEPVGITRINGELSLSGQIPVLDGTASVSIEGFKFNGFEIDSLATSLSLTGPLIQVDRFAASRGRGKVTASGSVRMAGPLYTVLEREVFGPDIPGEDTHWNLEFNTQNIHLEEWFAFMLPSRRPAGLVTSRLAIGGDSLNPEISFWALADAVNVRGFDADHLEAKIDYRNGQVRMDTLDVWLEGEPVSLSGTFPLDLSFKPFTVLVPERPMDLVLKSRGGSLRNLGVTPWIDGAEGTFTGHVVAKGTPGDPLLEGELSAHADSVAIHDRSDVVRNANVWITLEDKVINVVAAEGELGGGRVTARGTYWPFAREEDSYRLNLNMNKAVVKESGLYAARVSGELALEPRIVDGIVYPFVSGDIRVHRAEFIGTLKAQDVSSTKAQALLYDVSIDAPSQIIVQTIDVKGEMRANIRAVQTPDRLELQGQMEIVEGEWYTPTAKFKMKEGSLTWSSTTTILPDLDVSMETLSGGYIIELEVTGPADAMGMAFTAYDPDTGENAGLSTEEIYRQLFFVGSGHLTTSTALATGSQYLLQRFDPAFLGRTGIIDDLAINPTYNETGEASYMVSVRKFLTPELSLRFGQELSRYFDPNFALEYRLGRSLFLRGETVRERTLDASTVTTRYQLDVSVRHDY